MTFLIFVYLDCRNLGGGLKDQLTGIWNSWFGDGDTTGSSQPNLDQIISNVGKLPEACVKDALDYVSYLKSITLYSSVVHYTCT
jgi:hypothetical protein